MAKKITLCYCQIFSSNYSVYIILKEMLSNSLIVAMDFLRQEKNVSQNPQENFILLEY